MLPAAEFQSNILASHSYTVEFVFTNYYLAKKSAMRNIVFSLFFVNSFIFQSAAQKIVSGPMIGHVEFRTAVIWAEFSSEVENAELSFKKTKGNNAKVVRWTDFVFEPGSNVARVTLTALEPGTTYVYSISINRKVLASGEITTQQLWQYRTPAPDFSFLTGSCAYFNQPEYDRPGKPYGSDSVIFEAMAKEKSDFMIWLGDNWYTREVDYFSSWGLNYRASRDRATKVLQPFLKAMPHYAIWDDHDYGWNNADKSYPLKKESREVFMKYWANPSFGENDEGVYTKMTWNDVDVFMLDSRWFRSNDLMKDSINGKPNSDKRMFGEKQMDWLKNALLQSKYNSNISFRFIATGSQVLNPFSDKDCLREYPLEYEELISFITGNNIDGVIFLTGDRHHSEIIKLERNGKYPLYDITASSFTAGISKTTGEEINNPYRVSPEIQEHNYARISLSGDKKNRKATIEFLDIKGKKLADWSVLLKDISDGK
jgi:alkaline phosphatase D